MIVYTQQICTYQHIIFMFVKLLYTKINKGCNRWHFAVNTFLCIPAVRHVMSWFLTSKVCYVTKSGESVGAAARSNDCLESSILVSHWLEGGRDHYVIFSSRGESLGSVLI